MMQAVWGVLMFENVELGHRLDKGTYRERSEAVRLQLLDLEYRLVQERSFATLILINGVDKAGKGETMNLLNSWLDPRHLDSHAIDRPSSEEEERPYMWRFWRACRRAGASGSSSTTGTPTSSSPGQRGAASATPSKPRSSGCAASRK